MRSQAYAETRDAAAEEVAAARAMLAEIKPDVVRPADEVSKPRRGYVEPPDPVHARVYEQIRGSDDDTARMSENTGIPHAKLDQIKEHIFETEHDVAVGPNDVVRGRFTPDNEIAKLWPKATEGTLTPQEADSFHRLMAHEYVESSLMDAGLDYRSADPQAWQDGTSFATPDHHGAHELSPNTNLLRNPFAHYPSMLGLPDPKIHEISSDLSNLDPLIASLTDNRKES